jgi:hypothetical protein
VVQGLCRDRRLPVGDRSQKGAMLSAAPHGSPPSSAIRSRLPR